MLSELSPVRAAWIIFTVMFAAIAGAWIFEFAGYLPCDLCLKQRWAYYAVVPLTLLLALLQPSWILAGLWLALLILLGSMIFGLYHSGVEWKWWGGPGTCGAGDLSGGLPDLTKPVVKCDEAALRIPPFDWGLSLAGWNAVISAAMAWAALRGATTSSHGSSSASQ
jgi:disulfide bond formation protein DsbB